MIDTGLLQDYMNNFFGYGNLKSDFWFIGMEEGGGNSKEEIISRLSVWKDSGKPTVLDIHDFHTSVTNDKGKNFEFLFKGKESKYQRTWGGMIKILINYLEGQTPTLNMVKEFQSSLLGRLTSNNCLLEVFPLPSRGINYFDYPKWTNDFIKCRETYKTNMKDLRIQHIKKLIEENTPKFIVFLSTSSEYIKYWSLISDINFDEINSVKIIKSGKKVLKAKFAQKQDVTFGIIHHPVYPGVTNNYFKVVAEEMKGRATAVKS